MGCDYNKKYIRTQLMPASTSCYVTQELDGTVIMALLQPTPECFAQFDEVFVLRDGQVSSSRKPQGLWPLPV